MCDMLSPTLARAEDKDCGMAVLRPGKTDPRGIKGQLAGSEDRQHSDFAAARQGLRRPGISLKRVSPQLCFKLRGLSLHRLECGLNIGIDQQRIPRLYRRGLRIKSAKAQLLLSQVPSPRRLSPGILLCWLSPAGGLLPQSPGILLCWLPP